MKKNENNVEMGGTSRYCRIGLDRVEPLGE